MKLECLPEVMTSGKIVNAEGTRSYKKLAGAGSQKKFSGLEVIRSYVRLQEVGQVSKN